MQWTLTHDPYRQSTRTGLSGIESSPPDVPGTNQGLRQIHF